MVRKIYETDSYIKETETVITEAGDIDGRHYICLEETVFFPEEGGQNADTGVLIPIDDKTGSPVDDQSIRILEGIIGDGIRYIVSAPLSVGTRVKCLLDWDVRYDRMQNHSGEHILTSVMHNKFGFDNVGFHLSDTGFVTIDLNGAASYEEVIEAEREANSVIYENLPIRDSYPDKDELKNISYRSKKDIEGQVRLITIGDEETGRIVDICACCAPHVRRTGEIGIIKVFSVINWKGGIRISMLCGRRALEYINGEHEILTETARSLSTEAVNIPERLASYRAEISQLKLRVASLCENDALHRVRELMDGEYCIFVDGDFPAASMKNVYNVLTEKFGGYTGVFAGSDEEGYRYNAGSSLGDSRQLSVRLKDAFGARGGGSPEMIQGRVSASKEEISAFFEGLNRQEGY